MDRRSSFPWYLGIVLPAVFSQLVLSCASQPPSLPRLHWIPSFLNHIKIFTVNAKESIVVPSVFLTCLSTSWCFLLGLRAFVVGVVYLAISPSTIDPFSILRNIVSLQSLLPIKFMLDPDIVLIIDEDLIYFLERQGDNNIFLASSPVDGELYFAFVGFTSLSW